ncbi:TonB-dependent receptor [Lysobacter sp. TY2-98]|uniref:TonB-dependent receptor plug domain-containing protein n=1 Tax=Lysobacter sp. TY2-98 TaxID=2290922 RepID=UPI000E201751|nr:TonB-dependent receptor [Lysobacter sp. TY2-98]AXK71350.1 TonB-dependent receptor [Lysobacter sp. TY2-98]
MTFKTTRLRDAITFALAVSAAGTGAAYAQNTTATPPSTDTKTQELGRVEVTGSRIRRAESETSQPIISLNREEIQAQGLTSVGDVIQNLAANGSTLNTTFNNGGNGETRVSLRNLGSNRTLVLVNGRRWVGGTGLGGAVDLNTIPTAAVERIEVLKAGASSIYGSDAIAGVVNVILRTDYQGAELNGYLGMFDKGDGFRQSYDFTIGTSDDRFSAMFGAGYVKEEPVMAGDREISAEPTYHTGVAFGSSTTPAGRFALCTGTYSAATGCSVGETRPNGTAGQFTYDPGKSGLNWRNRTGADLYNFAPDNYLLTPQERKSIFGRASVNLTDNVSAFITATYNNRRSEQLLAAMPIVLGSGPGANTQSKQITISRFSMYNPFGADVTRIQRRAVETGGRSFNQNVDTFGFNGGLEGSFERWNRYFTWDAGMVYGRNDENDTTYGLFNVLALRNALGPSEMRNGVPTCVVAPGGAAIPGCVPLNLLGAPGVITPQMLSYSSFVAHDETAYKMKDYYANITGEIAELPGGMLAFAAGVERRTESGYDSPDALIASGNTTGNARTPTSGGYSIQEGYVELSVPLLKDVPFAKQLEFDLSSRISDYSNFGQTTNSAFGFKWRPVDELMVRGNWAEGFRGPSILELYQGVADSFPTIADPCSTTFGGRYNILTPEQRARCTAQGVPAGGYDQGNAQIRISVGGNPNLQPETSTTKTLGVVWSPKYVPGSFDVSLDWWRIELRNAITSFSGQDILNRCILQGLSNYCTLFNRNGTGQINDLLSAGLNIGAQNVEGWDLTANYKLPEQSWGKLSFSLDATYQSLNEIDDNNDGIIDGNDNGNNVANYTQNNNQWRIRANMMTRWEKGDFGATWFTRFYSRQEESCPFYYNDYGFGELCNAAVTDPTTGAVDPVLSRNYIGATTYHDVSVYWKAPWNAKITVGVNNVFAKDPPLVFNAFANTFDPQYEVPGRFFYMSYNQKF